MSVNDFGLSTAGKIYIADKLIQLGLLKTSDEYVDFLNRPIVGSKSLTLIYRAMEMETKNETK